MSFQSLCNALKFALNNLLNDFKPMLPDLCGLVVSIIHSKFVHPVEIAQKCIILFYKDAECQSIMKQCFIEVVSYNILVFEVRVMMVEFRVHVTRTCVFFISTANARQCILRHFRFDGDILSFQFAACQQSSFSLPRHQCRLRQTD